MLLRHVQEPVGEPAENTFEAIDEQTGKLLGTCVIRVTDNPALFPNRPSRIYLELVCGDRGNDDENVMPDALLGAAVARARVIAREGRRNARIFTMLEPEETELMNALSVFGFKDNDGMVCMQRDFDREYEIQIPAGCVVVRDTLDDPNEQQYFLERYNRLYNEDNDLEWLLNMRMIEGFQRILIVSPTGMAGEILTWQEKGEGMIVWLHTAKRWQGMRIGSTLLDLACNELLADGIRTAKCEIQVRIPRILKLMERAGFRQSRLICRFPGIDVDAE